MYQKAVVPWWKVSWFTLSEGISFGPNSQKRVLLPHLISLYFICISIYFTCICMHMETHWGFKSKLKQLFSFAVCFSSSFFGTMITKLLCFFVCFSDTLVQYAKKNELHFQQYGILLKNRKILEKGKPKGQKEKRQGKVEYLFHIVQCLEKSTVLCKKWKQGIHIKCVLMRNTGLKTILLSKKMWYFRLRKLKI